MWYIGIDIAVIILMAAVLIIVKKEKRLEYYKQKSNDYEKYMKYQEEQIKNIIINDEKQKRFKHDIRAHILALQEYVKEQDYTGLMDYVETMDEISGFNNTKIYSGNTIVDAVIGDVVRRAEKENIVVKWKGTLPKEDNVAVYDWCILISNILNNSIEACEKIDGVKIVEAEIYAYRQRIFLAVKNPVGRTIEIKNNQLMTTKKEKKKHGYGTQNVKAVVEKYNGTIMYDCKNNMFSAEVLI